MARQIIPGQQPARQPAQQAPKLELNGKHTPGHMPVASADARAVQFERKLERRTFELSTPVHNGDREIAAVAVVEPLAHEVITAERNGGKPGKSRLAELLALISDLPSAETAGKLKARDLGRITGWIGELSKQAIAADGIVPVRAPGEADEDPFAIGGGEMADVSQMAAADVDGMAGRHTFQLLSPFLWDGKLYDRVTASEPTLDVMMTVARFKLESEQTAALVAGAIGETLPVVARMAKRDVDRIEAWLAPFVKGLTET